MPRNFDFYRVEEHCESVPDTPIGNLFVEMRAARVMPSVLAEVMDVRLNTMMKWLYGQSVPLKKEYVARIKVISDGLCKAREQGLLPRSESVQVEDFKNWYSNEDGYNNVTEALLKAVEVISNETQDS